MIWFTRTSSFELARAAGTTGHLVSRCEVARRRRGLSVGELASTARVSTDAVEDLERGFTTGAEASKRIAAVLGVGSMELHLPVIA